MDGVFIDWDIADTTEYLPLDFAQSSDLHGVSNTIETWHTPSKVVRYNIEFKIVKKAQGEVTVEIQYEAKQNKHLPRDEIYWGTTILTLTDKKTGSAKWRHEGDKTEYDAKWYRFSGADRERESYERAVRDQAKFRSILLASDKKCVVTGESTINALEAAHLVGVKDEGQDVIQNGILLRADLHRLFDAGKFSFDRDGKIIINGKVSKEYEKLFKKSKGLPRGTAKRVSLALEQLNRESK